MWWLVWVVLLVMGVIFEVRALIDKRANDTLSESIWELRTRMIGRVVFIPAWVWLTWHFLLEPAAWGPIAGVWWDDIIGVIAGVVVAVLVDYKEYKPDRT